MELKQEPTQARLLQIIQSEVEKIKVVDVGAGVHSTSCRYQPLIDSKAARVIGFEPNDEAFKQIIPSATGEFQYFPYAIGDGSDATLHITNLPECSSIYEPNIPLLNMFNSLSGTAFTVMKKIPVSTRRLDDIPECVDADYIKIDVQGAELDVLRGAVKTLEHTLVVEAEVEFIPLYKKQPLLGDLHCFMAANGFMLQKLIDIQGRPLGQIIFGDCALKTYGQALWADAIFVKESLLLSPENFTPQQLLKAAVLMYDVYWSYDTAIHLLRQFDARTGAKTTALLLSYFRTGVEVGRIYMNLVDALRDLPPDARKNAEERIAAQKQAIAARARAAQKRA